MNLQEKFMIMIHGKCYTGQALSVNGYLLPHTIELDQGVDRCVSYNEVLNICDYFDQSNLFETEVLPEHIYEKEEIKLPMKITPIESKTIVKQIEIQEYLYADVEELEFHSKHESIMFANGWTIKEYEEYEGIHDVLQIHTTYERVSYLNKEDLK